MAASALDGRRGSCGSGVGAGDAATVGADYGLPVVVGPKRGFSVCKTLAKAWQVLLISTTP
jgi:hypothetical protein